MLLQELGYKFKMLKIDGNFCDIDEDLFNKLTIEFYNKNNDFYWLENDSLAIAQDFINFMYTQNCVLI